MFQQLTVDALGGGVNLIDLGASGRLDVKWRPIEPLINLVGFDPNAEECRRLARQPTRLHSATYLPYAVGGQDGPATLHKTRSSGCYSVLPPNETWLERFSFADLFQVTGQEPIEIHRFGSVAELQDFDADAIKVDTQGLELPILANADALLDRAFYVETETGFVENYQGETTYAQMDHFMRDHGFVLFDVDLHRIGRRNHLAERPSGREQILWCEAVWLKDYVGLAAAGKFEPLSRAKARKALLLCALQGCPDFGLELAEFFHQRQLISSQELAALRRRATWQLSGSPLARLALASFGACLQLLPKKARRSLAGEADRVRSQPDLLKVLVNKRRKAKAA